MSSKKGSHSRGKDKQEAREYISEELAPEDFYENPDPIKTTLKLNEFNWTDKQKQFLLKRFGESGIHPFWVYGMYVLKNGFLG